MDIDYSKKVIIVEGLNDKKQIQQMITEDVEIICTNGTLGLKRLDELIDGFELDDRDVFVMVDEDKNGESLRALLKSELPHAEDIFIQREFKEVEKTPHYILAHLLWAKHIEIDPMYLR
ncbi:MAG TPA: topoisomerase [Candidatus Avamphibacillus intestinigallinarum]|nr:topoisomerase [Candidatus Avamphibacillus intestinigallinarum]